MTVADHRREQLRVRRQIRVRGTVQGVGFRPHVYRLARELGLGGWVLNDSEGVLLEVEGVPDQLDSFLARLIREAPPLAQIEETVAVSRPTSDDHRFVIRDSPRGNLADAPVATDTATCADCLAELADPSDRRYRYPFINCTNCGPRFTIVRGVPYDRPLTTMVDFAMCPACQAEYGDPTNRRFHAQPNACPDCGPSLRLLPGVEAHTDGDSLSVAARALAKGAILAIKGIGGFHLACRGDDAAAVARLRARKHREDRPFALMAASLAHAETLVVLNDTERALLCSPARPIVLARRRSGATVAAAVAPGAPELGVMLPYSPLHQLLLADVAQVAAAMGCGHHGGGPALVMTSANLSDEPIAYRDEDARRRLAGIADLLLLHDRPIETRTDDSVLRVVAVNGAEQPMFLRRSRGYVPADLALPVPAAEPILACGAELKNTFCLARGRRAWVGHHIGDLGNYETLSSFTTGIEHYKALFSVTPGVVVRDLHPDYLSSRYADALAGDEQAEVRRITVQHHHAHLAACLAEHGETGPAVGAIFDGSGLGADGTVWGGELLVGDLGGFRRVGALAPVRLPGGDRAVREPWRMACAWLVAASESAGEVPPAPGAPAPQVPAIPGALSAQVPAIPSALSAQVDPRRWQLIAEMAHTGVASPVTTSMGRLFDAVAALCGIRPVVSYEGQAAIELEAVCDPVERGRYEVSVASSAEGFIRVDPFPAVASVIRESAEGVAVGTIAARFHAGIAAATVRACVAAAADAGTELVVLSGGVFQNRRLVQATASGLADAGLRVLLSRRLPPGDGAISYGQAAVAAWASQHPGVSA